MPTNDVVDPTVQDAEQRVERAKASLSSRVAALKDKLIDVRGKLDLSAQIAKHPLPSVGIAFVLGMIAGRLRTAASGKSSPRSLTSAAVSALAAFGFRLVRDAALVQLSHAAQEWWARHDERPVSGVRASHAPAGEPLKH